MDNNNNNNNDGYPRRSTKPEVFTFIDEHVRQHQEEERQLEADRAAAAAREASIGFPSPAAPESAAYPESPASRKERLYRLLRADDEGLPCPICKAFKHQSTAEFYGAGHHANVGTGAGQQSSSSGQGTRRRAKDEEEGGLKRAKKEE